MSNNPITFVHLTDLHLKGSGSDAPVLLADTEAALRRSLDEIKRMSPMPSFVVISGDLADAGEQEAYQLLKDALADLTSFLPVLLALGNHDKRAGFVKVFPELHQNAAVAYDHDCVVEDLHVIVLDSSVPGVIGGQIDQDQIEWLKCRLEAQAGIRKLLVVHHPPFLGEKADDGAWHSLDFASSEALRNAVEGYKVVGILSGHIHLDRVSHWHGIPVITGTGHHAAADPLAPEETITLVDASGLAVCTLWPSGLSVTFVAHPQSRAELRSISTENIRARECAARDSVARAAQ